MFHALIGGQRKLHNDHVHNLCSLPEENKMGGGGVHVSFVGEIEIMYKKLIICITNYLTLWS
jgi:hypothetical protein